MKYVFEKVATMPLRRHPSIVPAEITEIFTNLLKNCTFDDWIRVVGFADHKELNSVYRKLQELNKDSGTKPLLEMHTRSTVKKNLFELYAQKNIEAVDKIIDVSERSWSTVPQLEAQKP